MRFSLFRTYFPVYQLNTAEVILAVSLVVLFIIIFLLGLQCFVRLLMLIPRNILAIIACLFLIIVFLCFLLKI